MLKINKKCASLVVLTLILAFTLTLGSPTLFAQATEEPGPPTLTTSGTGTITVKPDKAEITFGVFSVAKTAAQAQADNAQKLAATLKRLREMGIKDEDLKTINFSLRPEYIKPSPQPEYIQPGEGLKILPQPRENWTPQIVGYRAENSLVVSLDGVDKVGSIIDTVIASGANQVISVHFGVKDEAIIRRQALAAAAREAKAKAETIADALGVKLAEIINVSDGGIYWPKASYRAMEVGGAEGAVTPIEPGQLEIVAHINIVFRLAP